MELLFSVYKAGEWHGLRPPGKLCRLFLITINTPSFQVWWRGVRVKDPDGYHFRQEKAAE